MIWTRNSEELRTAKYFLNVWCTLRMWKDNCQWGNANTWLDKTKILGGVKIRQALATGKDGQKISVRFLTYKLVAASGGVKMHGNTSYPTPEFWNHTYMVQPELQLLAWVFLRLNNQQTSTLVPKQEKPSYWSSLAGWTCAQERTEFRGSVMIFTSMWHQIIICQTNVKKVIDQLRLQGCTIYAAALCYSMLNL